MNRVAWGVFSDPTRHALQNILWITVLCIASFSGCADSSGSPEGVRNQPLGSETFISEPSSPDALIAEATSAYRESHPANISKGTYAGSQTCGQCHREAFAQWQQSHHGQAMAHPTPETVKGEFSGPDLALGGQRIGFSQKDDQFAMRLDGADGELESFRVAYTFGTAPLQQYLTDMGDGRLQALPVVWDTREGGRGWYHLQAETIGQPDDVLHWTASGQNWNHMCADCHSTAVTKGFDERSARLWGGGGGRGERLRDRYCNPNITNDATIAANKDEDALLPEPSCSRAHWASIHADPCGTDCSSCCFAINVWSTFTDSMIMIWSIKVKAD